MEIRVLRYFVTMAREGNMTRAAERLFVTQPTLSKQLKDLEEELAEAVRENELQYQAHRRRHASQKAGRGYPGARR